MKKWLHPRKSTCNLKMKVWKMIFLFKQVIFRCEFFRGVSHKTAKSTNRWSEATNLEVAFRDKPTSVKVRIGQLWCKWNRCLFFKITFFLTEKLPGPSQQIICYSLFMLYSHTIPSVYGISTCIWWVSL